MQFCPILQALQYRLCRLVRRSRVRDIEEQVDGGMIRVIPFFRVCAHGLRVSGDANGNGSYHRENGSGSGSGYRL